MNTREAKALALANQGCAIEQTKLGMMYYTGKGVPKRDYAKAAKWFRKAAEQGDAQAQYMLGQMNIHGQNIPRNCKEAKKWLQMAAVQGYVQAQYWFGMMYVVGEGVPRNLTNAKKWLQMAADQGHYNARQHLQCLINKEK